MNRVWNYLYTLAVAALLTGCALGGTEAGNPSIGLGTPASEPNYGQLSQYLLTEVCTKYNACYPSASATDCNKFLFEQTNIPAGFGLASGFGTAREMVNAERAGTIRADYVRFVNCVNDVRAIACSSNAISNSAPTGSTNTSAAYSGVINMIPTSGTSCAGVF